jgi:hypothetical protein
MITKRAVLSEPLLLGSRLRGGSEKASHRLVFRWKHHLPASDFKIAVVLVQLLSVDELCEKVIQKPTLARGVTGRMIERLFNRDEGIMMDNFRESLTCPVSPMNNVAL